MLIQAVSQGYPQLNVVRGMIGLMITKVNAVNPGPIRTRMRALAYPGVCLSRFSFLIVTGRSETDIIAWRC